MPLCSDEIYWGEIRATNLPPRHITTKTYITNILYHLEKIDGATAPPLPSVFRKNNTAALKLFATEVGEWLSTLNTNLKVEPQLQLNQFLLALLCWGVSNKACQQDVPLELGVLC